jgi:hypothetical protein
LVDEALGRLAFGHSLSTQALKLVLGA